MIELDERQHALACMEVWGTNRGVTRAVELPELTAWVYSKPAEGEDGGDVHYLSVCGQAVLSPSSWRTSAGMARRSAVLRNCCMN